MWALVLGRGGFEPPKALGQLIYSQSRLTASVSARPRDFTDNRAMGKLRWILWQGLISSSMERFTVGASNAGFELSGLILQAHEESPYVVRYGIEVDAAWRTRKVEVELEDGVTVISASPRMARVNGGAMVNGWTRLPAASTSISSGHPRPIRSRSGGWGWHPGRRNRLLRPGCVFPRWRCSGSSKRTTVSRTGGTAIAPVGSRLTSWLTTTASSCSTA